VTILQIRTEAKNGLNTTVDALVDRIPEIDACSEQIKFVHTGSSIMASGEAHYVGIDIKLPDLSEEMLEALQPLFETLVALIGEQEGSAISAQLVVTAADGQEAVRQITKASS
jgi:hypothetical protein